MPTRANLGCLLNQACYENKESYHAITKDYDVARCSIREMRLGYPVEINVLARTAISSQRAIERVLYMGVIGRVAVHEDWKQLIWLLVEGAF